MAAAQGAAAKDALAIGTTRATQEASNRERVSVGRISDRFQKLAGERRAAFIPFIMAGDPDEATSLALMRALPDAGADLIELGVCFTDPMADGPAIQSAGLRALKAGQTLARTLAMVRAFREQDRETPVVLMGYYNPIHAFGAEGFAVEAKAAGVDGLIVVDLPPEEDGELRGPAAAAGLDIVRLATPTTDAARTPKVVNNASGFLYYVSVAGVTGSKTGETQAIREDVGRLKAASGLPVAVGFGVKTAEKAAEIARHADAVVVGSALVERIQAALDQDGGKMDNVIKSVLSLARDLSGAVRRARSLGS